VPCASTVKPGIFFNKSSTFCSVPLVKNLALKFIVSLLMVIGFCESTITSFKAKASSVKMAFVVMDYLIKMGLIF
jgi:hypothetical protein